MNPSEANSNARTVSRARVHSNEIDGTWPMRLWVVDDNENVRDLLADLLGGHESIMCPRRFSSAEETIEALTHETPPDAILMDLNMGGMSGIDAIAPIQAHAPGLRVFIMTTFYDGAQAARATRCGAAAFLLKGSPIEETISCLERTPAVRALPALLEKETEQASRRTGVSRGPWLPRALSALRGALARRKFKSLKV